MKASFFTESILYGLAKGLAFGAQKLSPTTAAAVGRAVGSLAYQALPRRRLMALKNLRAAFGNRYTPAQYQVIIRKMFQNFGMTFIEIARIPVLDRATIDRWVELAPQTKKRVEEARAQGKGAVVLTGHFGNWELISLIGYSHGYPCLVLARQQGWPRLNQLLVQYRESKGCRVITKGFAVREVIRGLREGRLCGILSDQDAGRNGILSPFLGRLASTAPGAIALGIETGAPILPSFMVRTQGALHRFYVEEPIQIDPTLSFDQQIQQGVAAYLQALERKVREHPEQWLWLHRRWKSSPQRKVLIFSDGKAGHLNQSMQFFKRVEQAWARRLKDDHRLKGIDRPLVHLEVVEISFRNRFSRALLSLVASVVPRRYLGGDFWLKRTLTAHSYEAIRSAYADLSISCGAGTAAVNLLWAWGVGAKSIHITQTRFPSWRRFDLAVIPQHDRLPRRKPKNLIVTQGALTPIFRTDLEEKDRWKKGLGVQKPTQIGLLLGGPTRGMTLTEKEVEAIIQGLLATAEILDAELLVTTSRRTPRSVEEKLKSLLKPHSRCRLLTLANLNDPDGLSTVGEAVPCILQLSDVIVSTGDSISMVSEALSTGKPVVSFLPTVTGWTPGRPKHYRFLKKLELTDRLVLTQPQQAGEAVRKLFNGGGFTKSETSSDPVLEMLEKWL